MRTRSRLRHCSWRSAANGEELMHRRCLFFGLAVFLNAAPKAGFASSLNQHPPYNRTFTRRSPAVSGVGKTSRNRFSLPSSPDNWRGGTGNWSNGADWTGGLPAGSSDVTINTGTDTVVLDTSSSINSLTLGGATGRSFLTGDGNAHTVTIAGALTVNPSGSMLLLADNMTVAANSSNVGAIDLENGSTLQVNGSV